MLRLSAVRSHRAQDCLNVKDYLISLEDERSPHGCRTDTEFV